MRSGFLCAFPPIWAQFVCHKKRKESRRTHCLTASITRQTARTDRHHGPIKYRLLAWCLQYSVGVSPCSLSFARPTASPVPHLFFSFQCGAAVTHSTKSSRRKAGNYIPVVAEERLHTFVSIIAQASGQRDGEGKAGLWKCVVCDCGKNLLSGRVLTGQLRFAAQEVG